LLATALVVGRHLRLHEIPRLPRKLTREHPDEHEHPDAHEEDQVLGLIHCVAIKDLLREDANVCVDEVGLDSTEEGGGGKGEHREVGCAVHIGVRAKRQRRDDRRQPQYEDGAKPILFHNLGQSARDGLLLDGALDARLEEATAELEAHERAQRRARRREQRPLHHPAEEDAR